MPAPAKTSTIDFRPDAPEFLADPFPIYGRLREQDPVHWSPRLKAWVLTRYDDVKSVLLDRSISSDRPRLRASATSSNACPPGWCSATRRNTLASGG